MTKLIGTLLVSGNLVLLPAMARPQDHEWDAGEMVETTPPSTASSEPPPAPPSESPPAPPAQGHAQASLPPGQWVYTQQYGWIWMPYSDDYTYSPPGGYGVPYVYGYYPVYGWTWLAAPWVWGVGPWPFFGVYGPARFGWYAHGWWRYPSRWHYAPSYWPAPVPYRWGGRAFIGVRGGGFVSHVGPMGRGSFGWAAVRPGGHGGGRGFAGHGGFGGHGGGGHAGRHRG